jgi:hypothetical protein
MVIGKKIDKLKRWDLGNDQIEETNVYKYLGVYFSRSLKFIMDLLLHTVAPYGSLPQFQVLKTLKVCSTKLKKLF